MRVIFATVALAAGLALAGAASAQCAVGGPPQALTAVCPNGVGVLTTSPGGVVTGMIGGQVFVGQQVVPGVLSGTLDGQPFPAVPGVNSAVPFLPPPTAAPVAPPPAPYVPPLPAVTTSRTFIGTAATRAAARRRADYLRRLREAEATVPAERQRPGPVTPPR
jgi:hypothetical protein